MWIVIIMVKIISSEYDFGLLSFVKIFFIL